MSDNYTTVTTPSTDDVRECFAFRDSPTWSERVPERYELFDAWLAEHDQQVLYGYVKMPTREKLVAALVDEAFDRDGAGSDAGETSWDDPYITFHEEGRALDLANLANAILTLLEETPDE